ncbi:MAG TPA: hypothetical protein VIV40_05010 [Kofleriaceae bacterium]
MRLVAIAVLLSACVIDEPHDLGVVGSSADMTTPAGDYSGYRVVTGCGNSWSDVGVIGTGSVELTQVADIAAAGQDLHERVTDLASVWGWGGYGLVCEPGVGTQIDLSNWRDVDTVIARTGAWLAEHDYKLQVSISVEGWPVPDASD